MKVIFAYCQMSLRYVLSYRLAFIIGLAGPVISLATFFFIDRLFHETIAPHLASFGVNYFAYVLVGVMASGFLGGALGSVSSQITQSQMIGTLESLLITQTSFHTIVLGMMVWNFLIALFDIILYILAGIFLFGVNFGSVNIFSTVVVLVLAIISFNCLGLISASFVLAFKRGDPLSYLMNLGMEILGGVYFPVTVLPGWLNIISYLFPITYAIRSLERTVYQGAGLDVVWPDVLVLAGLSLVLLPLSIICLNAGLNYARRRGTLVQY